MAKKKKEVINLLPQEEFAASTVGRILTWLLSTFRMIVIATEMVVMAAFLSRFWLDARNTDLSDEIKQKQAIISSYKDVESRFRSSQAKLAIISALTGAGTNGSAISSVSESLPPDVLLSSISIEKQIAKIAGLGASERSISQLMVNLGAEETFSSVNLNQLSSDKAGNGLIFSIDAALKTQGETN